MLFKFCVYAFIFVYSVYLALQGLFFIYKALSTGGSFFKDIHAADTKLGGWFGGIFVGLFLAVMGILFLAKLLDL